MWEGHAVIYCQQWRVVYFAPGLSVTSLFILFILMRLTLSSILNQGLRIYKDLYLNIVNTHITVTQVAVFHSL